MGTVTPRYNNDQLAASSAAAVKAGVPLQLVRNVTGFKYGNGATPADFLYTAQQLQAWYLKHYKTSGNALVAWRGVTRPRA